MRQTHAHAFLLQPTPSPATNLTVPCCSRTPPTLRFGRIAGRSPPPPTPPPASEPPPYRRKADAALLVACRAANAAYRRVQARLVGDTLMLVVIWPSLVWTFGSVDEAKAALLGSVAGFSYVLFLSPNLRQRRHQSSSRQALRYLLLPLLVTHVARNYGLLQLLPALVGYFGYKVARVVPQLTGEPHRND